MVSKDSRYDAVFFALSLQYSECGCKIISFFIFRQIFITGVVLPFFPGI